MSRSRLYSRAPSAQRRRPVAGELRAVRVLLPEPVHDRDGLLVAGHGLPEHLGPQGVIAHAQAEGDVRPGQADVGGVGGGRLAGDLQTGLQRSDRLGRPPGPQQDVAPAGRQLQAVVGDPAVARVGGGGR